MRNQKVLVRGGGDLSSAIIHKLHRSGFRLLVLETAQPLAIRRTVAFSEAVQEGHSRVEDVEARLVTTGEEIKKSWRENRVPIMVDPEAKILEQESFEVVVDAIMAKKNLGTHRGMAPKTIAIGPGFEAGKDVDIVIETNRGHHLGRLIFHGTAQVDTGSPGSILGYTKERVIRSPGEGVLRAYKKIGDLVKAGDPIASVEGKPVETRIDGVVRGLIREGTWVSENLKIADVDPRGEVDHCYTISEKGRNIAGGVLEAILLLSHL